MTLQPSSDSGNAVRRGIAIGLCAGSMLVCLAYNHWRSDLPEWWRWHGGGIPYVVFWIALWFAVFPSRCWIIPICVGVTLVTCLLEFLQLWRPEWLIQIRSTRIGAALLGSGFTWRDIPPYLLGGTIGFLMLHVVDRRIPDDD